MSAQDQINAIAESDMPSYDALYGFLRSEYKHSRFEGRNSDSFFGPDHSKRITQSCMEDLKRYGEALISHHEAQRCQTIRFGPDLKILNLDEAPVEYPTRTGHLAHLLD